MIPLSVIVCVSIIPQILFYFTDIYYNTQGLLHRNVYAVFTYLFPICSLIYKGELKRSPLLITLYYSILADILCEHRLVKQQWRRTSTIT